MRRELGLATIACALLGCTETGDKLVDTTNIQLARFELSNGNRLTLTSIAPDNEIIVSETTPAGEGERFVVDDYPGATPLELFARLTPAEIAVPPLLADSATDADRATWMAQRQIGTTPGAGEFYLDVEELGWQPVSAAAPGNGSCNSATGYLYFEDHHCDTAGGYGYGVAEEDCDNTASFSYWQRSSAAKMRHTYTRSAVCNGTGWIRHSRYSSGWLTVLDEPIEENTVATYYSYRKSGLKQYRRSRVEPLDPFDADAYVRLWTIFQDQVVANAP
jgi:hypothetical protein